MFVWKKLASAKWEDAWLERLEFIGPTRLVVTSLPGSRTIRIEAYGLTKREADTLLKEFGGQIRTIEADALSKQAGEVREPIRIRSDLLVVSSERERQRSAKQFASRKILVVPAAMAFGTGAHATTASCLRFLSDLAGERCGEPWEMLDLGTGSGILAIAGRMLGARKVAAFDFDPHAVRTARENVRLNGVDAITLRKLDVTRWAPARQWNVVAANLFSSILISAAPAIARATKAGGHLIFSGILREQERECVRAFGQNGFQIRSIARRGKWVTGRAQLVDY